MKHISAFVLCAFAGLSSNIHAQQAKDSTLNRTVVVENQYNPEVMDAFKVNILPKVEEPSTTKRDIDYATSLRPLTAWPVVPMGVMATENRHGNEPRGYLRGAYGNRNNTDAKLSYLWDLTSRDRLQVMGSLYGFYGNIPSLYANADDWKSRFFRTDASLDYRHDFGKIALSAGGSFMSQVFNYMPEAGAGKSASAQHFTSGEGYVGIGSSDRKEAEPVAFALNAGIRVFDVKYPIASEEPMKETNPWLSGYMEGKINDAQRVGVALGADYLTYSTSRPDFIHFRANPYYLLENENLRLRVGAKLSLQDCYGSGLTVSPDVKLDYHFAGTYGLFVYADGGTTINSLKHLNELTPYWMPGMYGFLKTSHTIVDAQAGVKGSPLPGVGFRLFGGFKAVADDAYLVPQGSYVALEQYDSRVAFGGASCEYGYKDRFDVSVKGMYYSWLDMADDVKYLLYLKPQYSFSLSAKAKVFDGFSVGADYHYEGRAGEWMGQKADAVSNLTLSAGYECFRRLNIFARLDNVLNQNYLTEWGYPVQGFSVMGGISIRF